MFFTELLRKGTGATGDKMWVVWGESDVFKGEWIQLQE